MGKFVPVFIAFLQYCFGIYIFRKPDLEGSGPLFSCLITLLSIFILLLELSLYPEFLRSLWRFGNYVVQYLIAVYLTEHLMADFWFPLEIAVLTILPKTARCIEGLMDYLDMSGKADVVTSVLTGGIVGVFCSYMLSLFIFFTVLHGTRKIDLRMLEYGMGCFVSSITASLNVKIKAASLKYCNVKGGKRCTNRKRGGNGGPIPNFNTIEETSDDFDEDYTPQYIK